MDQNTPKGSEANSCVSDEALSEPELTVLMPCLNEAETIQICIRKSFTGISRCGLRGEVLVADNGSSDGSPALAIQEGARVVRVQKKGYGAALLGGISNARGRYVIMGDADDSYDFENLGILVDHLRGGADLVIGNRFKGGIAAGAMPPLHRYLGNPVLSFIGRLFFNIPIGDFHCGLRGFSRDAILALDLRLSGMEFASEMIVKAALAGLRIDEVPTTLKPDGRSRRPHLRSWQDGWRHLRFLLLYSPNWLFIYPGLFLIVAGLVVAAVLARGAIHIAPNVSLDIHTLVASCFSIMIGAQLIVFGVLARRFCVTEGLLPPSENLHRLFLRFRLEPILRVALVLFLVGSAGSIWALLRWAHSGFGPIYYNSIMRLFVISLTAATVGIQLAAAGFLASVFELQREKGT